MFHSHKSADTIYCLHCCKTAVSVLMCHQDQAWCSVDWTSQANRCFSVHISVVVIIIIMLPISVVVFVWRLCDGQKHDNRPLEHWTFVAKSSARVMCYICSQLLCCSVVIMCQLQASNTYRRPCTTSRMAVLFAHVLGERMLCRANVPMHCSATRRI
jgi:heme/copper-type cytochrome/quinol oxidase subunit 2